MPRTTVVALSGNAITRADQAGTHAEQAANARAMARTVCALRDAGWGVIVVHGNGPQVGCLSIQQYAADDPAFANPTKPIGPFFDQAEARWLAAERNWTVAPDAERGYRRMVASPRLLRFLELEAITDVEQVMLDYGTPDARPVTTMTAEEAQRHLRDDQFPDGSMGPKVRAAIAFVRAGGRTAVITNSERAARSLDPAAGDAAVGTRIVAASTSLEAAS